MCATVLITSQQCLQRIIGASVSEPHIYRRVQCEFSLFLYFYISIFLYFYIYIQVAELASLAQLLPACSPTVRNPAPDSSLKSCRLRPLQLLLPGPIAASASTAAPRLPPPRVQLLPLRDCARFSCCSPPDHVRFDCCSPIASA